MDGVGNEITDAQFKSSLRTDLGTSLLWVHKSLYKAMFSR